MVTWDTWSTRTHYEEVEEPLPELEGITSAAKDRARQADFNVNKGRCLIENSDASWTEVVDVLHRINGDANDVMNRLEWAWGMNRGTLNLDTRRNLTILSPNMRIRLRYGEWSLLPEPSVIRRFFFDVENMKPHNRWNFPKLEDETYKYTFIPLHDMEDVYISRQEEDGSVTIHEYPYPNFPVLTSHIHPTFAIMHIGVSLSIMVDPVKRAELLEKHDWLTHVVTLYDKWSDPFVEEMYRGVDYGFMSSAKPVMRMRRDNGPCTPPRRIPFQWTHLKGKRRAPRAPPTNTANSQTRPKKRQKLTRLKEDALDFHDEEILDVQEWFGTRLSSWVDESFSYPPLAPNGLHE
ncbi:hypothetical protein CVT24_002356 [Panaeolus cyanescens]|uniref:HNH nuclease domain-containing protein n=1 Tax=Panaeolus cyanescens TaxID=181874 RepID=A0A409W164_9AGAR|nr:hypothetical protein CVT24_002356 [Panaeolus cyanescens]